MLSEKVGGEESGACDGTAAGEELAESVEEQARCPKVPVDPGRPTLKEIEEHNCLHWPFRSWCPHCVRGKAVTSPHPRKYDGVTSDGLEATGVTTVSLDYCFVSGSNEDEGTADERPVLVVVDSKSSSMYALPTERKGVIPWVLKWIVEKLDDMGYAGVKITVKSDGEPAIVALVEALAVARKAETVPVRSPARESKCNGKVEREVRTSRGQFVAMKDHVETMLGMELPANGAVPTWLVMHAAQTLNCYKVLETGRTPCELVTGHRPKAVAVPFGEKVHFLKAQSKTIKKLTNWKMGIFLGISPKTQELIVGNSDGVFQMRTIRRDRQESRWNIESVEGLTTSVGEHFGGVLADGALTVPARTFPAEVAAPRGGAFQPRRTDLKPKDFAKYDFAGGCPGCITIRSGLGNKANHSDACRARFEALMSEDSEDKSRVHRAKDRMDHFVAEKVDEDAEDAEVFTPKAVRADPYGMSLNPSRATSSDQPVSDSQPVVHSEGLGRRDGSRGPS